MKVIAFMGQKGGTGKTTLAVHTAVLASQEDPRVVLIDTDPQQSSTTWGGSRQAESPIVATAAASQLDEVLAAARSEDVQMAFVDSAPHAAPSASDVARLADFVVIPTRASALDLAAAENTVRIVQAAGKPFGFVLNAIDQKVAEVMEALDFLQSNYGGAVAPYRVANRIAYSRSIASGRGVTEFDVGDGKAHAEIKLLWKWIKEHL
jgi:chromosome partitioning protein